MVLGFGAEGSTDLGPETLNRIPRNREGLGSPVTRAFAIGGDFDKALRAKGTTGLRLPRPKTKTLNPKP